MKPDARLSTLLLSAAVALLVLPSLALADTATHTQHLQLRGRADTSAVWDGTSAFVLGGWDLGAAGARSSSAVHVYNPATGEASLHATTLAGPRAEASATWTDDEGYLFGGYSGAYTDEGDTRVRHADILRFNPALPIAAAVAGTTLPTARTGTAAIWDGSSAYVFGGVDSTGGLDDIVEFDPSGPTATLLTTALPAAASCPSAVWDGTYAYIFGAGSYVVKFDPSTGNVTTLSAALPTGLYCSAAFWDGDNAFVVGGNHEIHKYDPAADEFTTMSESLTWDNWGGWSVVWDGAKASIIGSGFQGFGLAVTTYSLEPAAPSGLTAQPGAMEGEITLEWQAPPDDSYSVLTDYKVGRSASPVGPFAPVATVPAYQTTFVDGDLPAGVRYYYAVSAVNAGRDEGPASASASSLPAGDNDGIPTPVEALLCANQNSNFNFDGTCVDDDYSLPTAAGLLQDIDDLL